MGELINGRTPEEIKAGLSCSGSRGNVKCSECAYCIGQFGDEDCNYECDQIDRDALALIERLEAAQPKWISVKERLPTEEDGTDERKIICVPSKLYGSMAGNVRIYPWDIVASYSSLFTHWMPMPEPPEEGAHG